MQNEQDFLDFPIWKLFGKAVQLYMDKGLIEEFTLYVNEKPYIISVHVREQGKEDKEIIH